MGQSRSVAVEPIPATQGQGPADGLCFGLTERRRNNGGFVEDSNRAARGGGRIVVTGHDLRQRRDTLWCFIVLFRCVTGILLRLTDGKERVYRAVFEGLRVSG